MQALLDAARTSPLCGRQFRFQKRQGSDENDKGILVGRPVAPRPSGEHVGLDLTWLDAETSADARQESWDVVEMIQMHREKC